ncbi:MAG: hypothetical protein AB9882_07050 [Ignavibacteriaceae bacterium]
MALIMGEYNIIIKTAKFLKTPSRLINAFIIEDRIITCMKFDSFEGAAAIADIFLELGLKLRNDFMLIDLTQKLLPECKWLGIKKVFLESDMHIFVCWYYPFICNELESEFYSAYFCTQKK